MVFASQRSVIGSLNSTPPTQPNRCKTETISDLVSRIFLRLGNLTVFTLSSYRLLEMFSFDLIMWMTAPKHESLLSRWERTLTILLNLPFPKNYMLVGFDKSCGDQRRRRQRRNGLFWTAVRVLKKLGNYSSDSQRFMSEKER